MKVLFARPSKSVGIVLTAAFAVPLLLMGTAIAQNTQVQGVITDGAGPP
jgi:hypothetical protein